MTKKGILKTVMAFMVVLMACNARAESIDVQVEINKLLEKSENPFLNLLKGQQVPVPSSFRKLTVATAKELYQALDKANKNGGYTAIYLSSGVYSIDHVLNIKAPAVFLLGQSSRPGDVVLVGRGMQPTQDVDDLVKVSASGFVLDGVTLQNTGNHLIQIAAENDSDRPTIRNCVLQDSYEQLLKVSYNKNTPDVFSDFGLIEFCRFEYTTGIGPNYYIGGVDAHGIRNWVIRNNYFRDIASPEGDYAEHAVHIWSNSSDNIVDNNIIVDSDRGIGFGMRQFHPNIRYGHRRGIVSRNVIYHSDNHDPFADVGIIMEDSAETIIVGNSIFFENNYPNAIEYRFPESSGIKITGNKTNRKIRQRDGGEASLSENTFDLTKDKIEKILPEHGSN